MPRSQLRVGDLVRVVRLPKYWGASKDIRGLFGTVVEQGGHEERWVVLVDNRKLSLHRNHLAVPEDDEWGWNLP